MWFNGFLDLSPWQLVAVTLVLTHITIVSVTVYLHRYSAHRALDLHPALQHFFRFWLWLTTGMNTREWTAIHRKHHAKCETVEDPHSPVHKGLFTVLRAGAEPVQGRGEEPGHPAHLRQELPGRLDRAQSLLALPDRRRGADGAHRPGPVRRPWPDRLGRADGMDSVLGRRRGQRPRPRGRLSQLRMPRRRHQPGALGHPHRRRRSCTTTTTPTRTRPSCR